MTTQTQGSQRNAFLERMSHAMAWSDLEDQVNAARGSKAVTPDTIKPSAMIRIYFMQRWFGLSDGAMVQALQDVQSMRAFAGLSASSAAPLHEKALQEFREFFEAQHIYA